MKIGVIGAGAWGLALANILCENNNKVTIYDKNIAKMEYFIKNHTCEPFLDHKFSNDLNVELSLETLVKSNEILLLAVPTKFIGSLVDEIKGYINSDKLIINVAKGFEPNTKLPIIEFIESKLNDSTFRINIGAILGPGFAYEVINHNLTCVCGVSKNKDIAKFIQKLFSNSYFRVYALTDTIGAEIGTSLKNAIAIGSGIVKGLGYGENTKAALITRGIAEIKRFGKHFGAKESTFLGLTGIGDLVLTCNTNESRNFSAGYEIGLKNDAKDVINDTSKTIEGILTIKTTYELSQKLHISMPIISALYEVLFNDLKPSNIVQILMQRPLKNEDF